MGIGLLTLIFPFGLIYAALSDVSSFRIPNWLSIALVAAFPVVALACGMPVSQIGLGLLTAFGMLAVGFALFALNVFGGGDAKLLAAAAAWVGPGALLSFLIMTALAGGLVTLAILGFRTTPIQPFYVRIGWLMRLHEARAGAPYGLAIAIGGVIVFSQTPLFAYAFGL